MSMTIFFSMFTFAFVLSIFPGPVNVLILASSLNYGFKKTFSFISGATIGFTILLIIVSFGFKEFIIGNPFLASMIEIIGALFIMYMGYKIISSNSIDLKADKPSKYLRFHEGFLLQWLNPKAWFACIAGVTLYSNSQENLYFFIILYFIVCYACLSFWAIVGDKISIFFNSPLKLKVFNILMGGILIISALYIIISKI